MTAQDQPVWLQRAPVVAIYEVLEELVFLGKQGGAQRLSGDSARLARAVLDVAIERCTRVELVRRIAELAGEEPAPGGALDQLLDLLIREGVLLERPSPSESPRRPAAAVTHHPRVLLGICGAVAAMHAPGLVQRLQHAGYDVRCAATQSALSFFQPDSLAALTHRPVASALRSPDDSAIVPHIELSEWADIVLVWPATATTISRLACADYSSLVASVALAATCPVLVVPSMNARMLAGAGVRRNLEQLCDDGFHVAHAAFGVEVADRPLERRAAIGPAPPHDVVLALLGSVLESARERAAGELPVDAAGWDRRYRTTPAPALSFHCDDADEDIVRTLSQLAPEPVALLDVGTGLGSVALAAAALGHRVVATDVSPAALDAALARAPDQPVIWLEDDITRSGLRSGFQLAVDRGCLHLLSAEGAVRCAATLTRLIVAGGHLIVKTHSQASAPQRLTNAYDAERMKQLFGATFELVSAQPSSMPGGGGSVEARLFVLRRRG